MAQTTQLVLILNDLNVDFDKTGEISNYLTKLQQGIHFLQLYASCLSHLVLSLINTIIR